MTSQEVEIEFSELRNAAKKEDFIEVEYSEKPSLNLLKVNYLKRVNHLETGLTGLKMIFNFYAIF